MPPEPMEERPLFEGEPTERARVGGEVLSEVVKLAGLDVTPRLVEDADEEIHFDLAGEDAVRVIGNKGDALLALQFLTNRIIARKAEGNAHIVLDAANYRSRRREALAQLAKQLAARAVDESKVVRLSPMSAHDRRIFHITLEEDDTVSTRSEGDGLYRPLLIIPAAQE
jgi:spoIIIJ-associated protein